MAAVIVSALQQTVERGSPAVSASIQIEGIRHEIYYRASQGPLAEGLEPFLALAILPAMKLGAPVSVEGAVSELLLARIAHLQDLVATWFDGFQRVPVHATVRAVAAINLRRGVGCFFSAGVDSFYSFFKHQAEITQLIFMHGFDLRLDDRALRAQVAQAIYQAAADLGKPVIEVETNARDLLDMYVDWWRHGALSLNASIAYLLSPQLQTIYMAAGTDYRSLRPAGRTPLMIEGWNTREVEIVDDGREATRFEKVQRLAESDIAMHWLRVCWENRGGAYNCGQCGKCLHTMLNLHMAGALQKCQTLPHMVDLQAVRQTRPIHGDRVGFEQTLAQAERLGTFPEIAAALRQALGAADAAEAETSVADDLYETRRRLSRMQERLALLTSSRSWKLTAPLRSAAEAARVLRERSRPWKK